MLVHGLLNLLAPRSDSMYVCTPNPLGALGEKFERKIFRDPGGKNEEHPPHSTRFPLETDMVVGALVHLVGSPRHCAFPFVFTLESLKNKQKKSCRGI